MKPKRKLTKKRQAALVALQQELGARKVITEGHDKYMASFDSSKLSFDYDALVRVRAEKDVGIVLRLANQYHIPVTSRGTGTSLTGSASPARGGWVLDLSLMKRITIKKEKGMAVVQPGAVVKDIQDAAEEEGMFYPPDPSSQKYCTIGGNVACNAGGMRGAKYGVTRDYVVALEGYLPTGEKVSWGGEYRKFATGYNVRDLWIGSEGTLGVVTKVVLKLVPLPEAKWTALFAFKNAAAALQGVKDVLGMGLCPSILEFMDRHTIYCAENFGGVTLMPEAKGMPLLLMEFDGDKDQLKRQKKQVIEWAKRDAVAYKESRTQAQAEALWEVRRKCSGAMFALGDSKLNEDIVVPLENQTKFIRFVERLIKRSGLAIATFGHAADGNFHTNIMYYRDSSDEKARAKAAVRELMEGVVKLGGTISGEHGIGLAKTPFMSVARGEAEIMAMKAIKSALDPNNILNPGKLFEVYEVWDHLPEKVNLPWDKKRPPAAARN